MNDPTIRGSQTDVVVCKAYTYCCTYVKQQCLAWWGRRQRVARFASCFVQPAVVSDDYPQGVDTIQAQREASVTQTWDTVCTVCSIRYEASYIHVEASPSASNSGRHSNSLVSSLVVALAQETTTAAATARHSQRFEPRLTPVIIATCLLSPCRGFSQDRSSNAQRCSLQHNDNPEMDVNRRGGGSFKSDLSRPHAAVPKYTPTLCFRAVRGRPSPCPAGIYHASFCLCERCRQVIVEFTCTEVPECRPREVVDKSTYQWVLLCL